MKRTFVHTDCRFVAVMLIGALISAPAVVSPLAAKAESSTTSALSAGTNILQFPNSTGDATKPIRVWCYKPRNCPANAPIVIVMHGVNRDADRYCREWAPYAEQSSFLLVCPEFDAARFDSHQYTLGNIFDQSKQLVPSNLWTFTTVENLFDWIKEQSGNTSSNYYLFGHSAGAQFVHRLVLMMPNARYQRAVAANAGFYMMPTYSEHKFPYGLKDVPVTPDALARSFSRDFVLMLGDQDVNATDSNLNQGPTAEEQGATRLERGQKFFATAQYEAKQLVRPCQWRLQIVPGAHHSDSQMAAPAMKILFPN